MKLPVGVQLALEEWWCDWCGWSAHAKDLDTIVKANDCFRVGVHACPRCGSRALTRDDERGVVGPGQRVGPPSRADSREVLRTGLPGFDGGLRGKGASIVGPTGKWTGPRSETPRG